MLSISPIRRVHVSINCDSCGEREGRIIDSWDDDDVLLDKGWEHEWRKAPRLGRGGSDITVCSKACLDAAVSRRYDSIYRESPESESIVS